jgi:hypothetical protein
MLLILTLMAALVGGSGSEPCRETNHHRLQLGRILRTRHPAMLAVEYRTSALAGVL